jgi:hypothetical protein
MKAPVLVVADAASARAIRTALADFDVTVTDSVTRASALASTGAFLCVFAARGFGSSVPDALELDVSGTSADVAATARSAFVSAAKRQETQARADDAGGLTYDEYVELTRYALTRRYLLALLGRHNGSVTDAAKGANMKRESLHRLMRRYHVTADDFRDR